MLKNTENLGISKSTKFMINLVWKSVKFLNTEIFVLSWIGINQQILNDFAANELHDCIELFTNPSSPILGTLYAFLYFFLIREYI